MIFLLQFYSNTLRLRYKIDFTLLLCFKPMPLFRNWLIVFYLIKGLYIYLLYSGAVSQIFTICSFRGKLSEVYRICMQVCCTVELLKTDTLWDRLQCPSNRGVRLVEVLEDIIIQQKELYLHIIVVGQTPMVYCSKVKILLSVANNRNIMSYLSI